MEYLVALAFWVALAVFCIVLWICHRLAEEED